VPRLGVRRSSEPRVATAWARVICSPQWQALFSQSWPGWRAWYVGRGGAQKPQLAEAVRALHRYMPELVPVWERLVELAGGDELAARFLTFWRPPAYLVHCSQAVLLDHEGPLLVRNYDFDPRLNEATVLNSAWTGRRVIATTEGIAGVADGINEDGLAASLAFGGRAVTGPGFGIPLILRYVLEVCDRVPVAVGVLRRVPSHMSYNVTLIDREGEHATVHVAPDRPTIVTRKRVTTNHQRRIEWPEQARFSRTLERQRHLESLVADPARRAEELIRSFLEPPLFSTDYQHQFGTVYTAAYRPAAGSLVLHWRDGEPWLHSFSSFLENRRPVRYALGNLGAGHPIAAEAPHGLFEQLEAITGGPGWPLPTGFALALADGIARGEVADWERFAGLWSGGGAHAARPSPHRGRSP
jgi:predicted choloylglycine hydrolase